MKSITVTKEPVNTICLKSEGGVAGAKQAFSKLESYFPSLRGRKFYGVIPKEGEYLACTRIEAGEDPAKLGLETYIIPGGDYATRKLQDWSKHLAEVGPSFSDMSKENQIDQSRPAVEFYKSFTELVLMLPIKKGN